MAQVFFELPAAELMRALRAARAAEIVSWEHEAVAKDATLAPLCFNVYVEPTPKGGFNFVGLRPNLMLVTNTLRGRSHVGSPFVFAPSSALFDLVPNDDVQASELVIVGTDTGVEVRTAGDHVAQHVLPGGWYREAPQGARAAWRRILATSLKDVLPGIHPQAQLSVLGINGLGVAETHHVVVRYWQRDDHTAPIVIRPTTSHVDFIAVVTPFFSKDVIGANPHRKTCVAPLIPQWLNPAAMVNIDEEDWVVSYRGIASCQGITGRAVAFLIAERLRQTIPNIDDMQATHTASIICDKIENGDWS